VVPPQMPTGGPIGEAVLDDESHGGPLDPEGIEGFGPGQVGDVGEEASSARQAPMLGLLEDEVDGAVVARVTEVMEVTVCDAVAAGGAATGWAATPGIIATVAFQSRRGQILRASDPLGIIRDIVTGWAHQRYS
jgi:hypothetical protein